MSQWQNASWSRSSLKSNHLLLVTHEKCHQNSPTTFWITLLTDKPKTQNITALARVINALLDEPQRRRIFGVQQDHIHDWFLVIPRPHRAEALSDSARLTSVCLTFCLSVAYIGPKSRTERPRKTNIGTELAHLTRDLVTTFKVKRSKVNLRGSGAYCSGLLHKLLHFHASYAWLYCSERAIRPSLAHVN